MEDLFKTLGTVLNPNNNSYSEISLPTSSCGYDSCKKTGGLVARKKIYSNKIEISCNFCRTNWGGYKISEEDRIKFNDFKTGKL